ncbi:SMP-30/gluconolactonase/LRE family protein [Rhizobium leguminosarum]|uniref:SMP-30/gluconolactonase/LRE family protein n=1 Tax=Rhizobium leguminosarum TaxID=384 RepID=UPI0024A91E8F|nr:SMP-30/gluconolactonase/LRE family protein [Rhizobium leguminosarum]MDI5929672.1 SMP-30/gluconolactonase/LRE family protein [Rhizobium leguminosarum]
MSKVSPEVTVAIDAGSRIGESVQWCERDKALFWTDVDAGTLHRWQPSTGSQKAWKLPEPLASFAFCEQEDRMLLGLASGIALFDLRDASLGPISRVEEDQPTTRINDGRCDAEGRFVFGTFNRVRGARAIGGYYRVGPDLEVERLLLPSCTVANGITFSPDGRRIYFADSPTAEIRWADYGADGSVGDWKTLVTYATNDGYPDGATVDAEGGVWSAHWDGGCVVRYGPDGAETDRVSLPVTRPTCVGFGGAEMTELFITTATIGLGESERAAQPYAGAILRVETKYTGLAARRFRF